MRKKMIFCLLIIIIMFSSCVEQGAFEEVSKMSPITTECTQTNSIENDLQITSDLLVGKWQDQHEVASGLTGHFHFFPDGNFRYDYNEMIVLKTSISESGKWYLEENKLTLYYEKREIIIGGTIVKDLVMGVRIRNMETEEEEFKYEEEYILTVLRENNDINILADYSMIFNNLRYWKLNGLSGNLYE